MKKKDGEKYISLEQLDKAIVGFMDYCVWDDENFYANLRDTFYQEFIKNIEDKVQIYAYFRLKGIKPPITTSESYSLDDIQEIISKIKEIESE